VQFYCDVDRIGDSVALPDPLNLQYDLRDRIFYNLGGLHTTSPDITQWQQNDAMPLESLIQTLQPPLIVIVTRHYVFLQVQRSS
jgi:hypothetical protein